MRDILPERVQRGRIQSNWGESRGNYGAFQIIGPNGPIRILSSAGERLKDAEEAMALARKNGLID